MLTPGGRRREVVLHLVSRRVLGFSFQTVPSLLGPSWPASTILVWGYFSAAAFTEDEDH